MVCGIVTIPVAVYAVRSFIASLENFISVIADWSAAYATIVAIEHFVVFKLATNCRSESQGVNYTFVL